MAQAFKLKEVERPLEADITGRVHPIHIAPSESHFSNINILGGDFCQLKRLRPWVHDDGETITYYIGRKKWSLPSKL